MSHALIVKSFTSEELTRGRKREKPIVLRLCDTNDVRIKVTELEQGTVEPGSY